MKHPTRAELERVRSGAASAEETAEVGGHVAGCAGCAAVADEVFSIRDSAAAFEAALAIDDGDERPRVVRRVAVWIGAAAAAAAVVAIVFLPRPRQQDPVAPAPVVVRTAPPAPVAVRPSEWSALLADARSTGRLPFPKEIYQLALEDSFRGGSQDAAVDRVWPAATAIDDEQPELRWPAMSGARFTVSITTEGEEVAHSSELTEPHWRVPVALRRGRMYRWQVRARKGEESRVLPAPPAPPAIFRVIAPQEHEELARARREVGDDHLLLALLHARAGMVDETRRELETYERTTRDPLARRLLRQLPQ